MNVAHVEQALRVILQRRSVVGPGTDGIRQFFKGADELFDMSGNDREMEILCGASLAISMEGSGHVAEYTALAVTTTLLHGARSADLPMDLPSSAEAAILRIAEANRTRPDLQTLPTEVQRGVYTPARDKILQQFDANTVVAAFDALNGVVEKTEGRLVSTLKRLNRYIAIQDEELDILWWLFGERSESRSTAFKDLSPKSKPLVFGRELADLTNFLPGPASLKGLLSRAGLAENKKLSIPEAVNACDQSWLSTMLPSGTISSLRLPIHFAITRKLETHDEASWIAGWAATCGVDEKTSFSSLALGTLFYRERLQTLFVEA